MAGVLRESLFSLEVVVEQLILEDITCRFPAVAFRLLDFPTLLIEHVEPELATKILQSFRLDVKAEIPRQITELQDRNGTYNIKKGKSCLFKIALETLRGHLTNTPLYVLLTDNFPEPPKLVGSCLISLHKTIELINDDVDMKGLSVPAVHGEKGTYTLYNLMGIEVGNITVAVRLLSLGEGLIPHIPDNVIAKSSGVVISNPVAATEGSSPRNKKLNKQSPRPKPNYRDVVIKDLEIADKQSEAGKNSKSDKKVTIDVKPASSAATQTSHDMSVQTSKPKSVSFDELHEPHFSNTYCPPSLFFKQDGEERRTEPRYQIFQYQEMKPKDDDLESVRSDDALFDLIEEGLTQTQIKTNSQMYVQYQQHQPGPVVYQNPNQIIPQPPNLRQMLSSPDFNAERFPFLRALMAELSFIQGVPMPVAHQQQQQQQYAMQTQVKTSPPRQRTPKQAWQTQQPAANIPKEKQSDFLARLSTPKPLAAKGRKSHRECVHEPQKQKSWIRKAPVFGQKKAKLQYGLTNTMRLRLAANNPNMLKSLEEEELANKTYKIKLSDGTRPGDEGTHRQRRPVPTPRRPSFVQEEEDEQIKEAEDNQNYEEEVSEQSTPRSIEVHMPQVSNQAESIDYDTDSEEEGSTGKILYAKDLVGDNKESRKPVNDKPPSGKLNTYPPTHKTSGVKTFRTNEESTVGQYSDDFEDSRQWMSTDEPELINLEYSDESPSEKSDIRPIKAANEPQKSVHDSQKAVINPRASDKSPVSSIRRSQSYTGVVGKEESVGTASPTPRPRRMNSQEDMHRNRRVSFEGFEETEHTSPNERKSTSSSHEISSSPISKVEKPLVLPQIARSSSVESTEDVSTSLKVKKSKNKAVVPKLPLSIHTDSVSSFMPSDFELENLANISVDDDYSEDFEGSDEDLNYNPFSKIPVSMLGYTA